jgi:WD repeat-containing protein 35
VLSGRALLSKDYYTCKTCRHKMIEAEVEKVELKHCALCHAPIDYKMFGVAID